MRFHLVNDYKILYIHEATVPPPLLVMAFPRVLMEHFEELLPIISTPTVRHACQRYGLMFKSLPRGLFVTLEDRGRVFRILKNWPERNVRVVVVTDGERVGPMGDLGVQVRV